MTPTGADGPVVPFSSPGEYRSAFESGLGRMLEEPTFGAFSLVLANASFDPN